jgi:hypothetical protein
MNTHPRMMWCERWNTYVCTNACAEAFREELERSDENVRRQARTIGQQYR